MNFKAFSAFLCGIGIFLFSVVQMSESMKRVCRGKAASALQKLTSSRISGVLTGAAVTGIVQSSAAVTVAATALVESGVLSASQGVGIIMGSNIGTTVTGVLAALKFSAAAPFLVFIGALLALLSSGEKLKSFGFFLCALSLLFVGVDTMKDAAAALNENGALSAFFERSSSRFFGIFIGFLSTAILQSSSATVGILQSLVSVGAVGREYSVFVICGQNIGATVPTLLSALRAHEKAKTTAVFHLFFNLFGTLAFLLASFFFPISGLFSFFSDGAAFVSAVHVFFNIFSTVLLFPFALPITRLSARFVAAVFKKEEKSHKLLKINKSSQLNFFTFFS